MFTFYVCLHVNSSGVNQLMDWSFCPSVKCFTFGSVKVNPVWNTKSLFIFLLVIKLLLFISICVMTDRLTVDRDSWCCTWLRAGWCISCRWCCGVTCGGTPEVEAERPSLQVDFDSTDKRERETTPVAQLLVTWTCHIWTWPPPLCAYSIGVALLTSSSKHHGGTDWWPPLSAGSWTGLSISVFTVMSGQRPTVSYWDTTKTEETQWYTKPNYNI